MTTIVEALRKRYPEPAYALITEVRNSTGHARSRTGYADAIAMGCWPSRGLDVQGFEFKTDRGDWIREWKNPIKADQFVKYCDYWWVVIDDEKIVKREELPKAWGLLVLHGQQLRTVVDAPKLKAKQPDRAFLASLLRSLCDQVLPQKKLDEARRAGVQEGRQSAEEWRNSELEHLQENNNEIKAAQEKMVNDFEAASGLSISGWNAGKIGDAVRRVTNSEHLRIEERLLGLKDTAKNILAAIDVALEHEKIKAQR